MVTPDSLSNSEKAPYFITTAIDYVNAAPHMGHAYEKVATDVMARFQRLVGRKVFFLTGTDEHGTKVEKTAHSQGKEAKAFTDEISGKFKDAWAELNLTYDRFIRTTDSDHYAFVSELWKRLQAKGDIVKKSYTGLYCTGCEVFMTARDLNDAGECAIHQRKPEEVQEENWFFLLSKYKQQLHDYFMAHYEDTTPVEPGQALDTVQTTTQFIKPTFRLDEALKMLEELQDISVSRPRSTVNWGIPVPDDPEQVIYVWLDALSNYATGVGGFEKPDTFKKLWGSKEHPNAVHIIGKDILRFHAIYWPAFLMAADLPLPKQLVVHGFINLNNSKISKSLGNVVAPQDLVRQFDLPNTDPIRYYLMTVSDFGSGQDGNFTEDDFKLKVNADLANNLGNLLNRTLNMTIKYFDGKIPPKPEHYTSIKPIYAEIEGAYQNFNFQRAAELILAEVDQANGLIAAKEPWVLHKEGKLDELAEVMYTVLDTLRQAAIALSPITPVLSEAIWSQLGLSGSIVNSETHKPRVRWLDIFNTPLKPGEAIHLQGPILPRLDSELAGAAKKK